MPVQTQLQQRRGTAASWTSTNPTLAAGEIGFETDTGKFKIGDGSTAWAALAYNTNGATASPLTTKGDLYTYSTGNTRLPVGANGETIVADSSTATGLRYQGNFSAGKNKVINGDFGIWQRGTSFTNTSGNGWNYYADRFQCYAYAGTLTVSRQTFTPGAAPVAGYEGSYFMRLNSTGTSTTFAANIEDVRTFAGQTVTVSMWLKSASAQTITTNWAQVFGSGGSSAVTVYNGNFAAITTSWARYSYTFTMPSISGKTIGTNSQLFFQMIGAINNELDVWGVQIEASNTATAFQTATGTIQGELAACQRYYWRSTPNSSFGVYGLGQNGNTIYCYVSMPLPITMRVAPTSLDVPSTITRLKLTNSAVTNFTISSIALDTPTLNNLSVVVTSSGLTGGQTLMLTNNNDTAGFIGASAEL